MSTRELTKLLKGDSELPLNEKQVMKYMLGWWSKMNLQEFNKRILSEKGAENFKTMIKSIQ